MEQSSKMNGLYLVAEERIRQNFKELTLSPRKSPVANTPTRPDPLSNEQLCLIVMNSNQTLFKQYKEISSKATKYHWRTRIFLTLLAVTTLVVTAVVLTRIQSLQFEFYEFQIGPNNFDNDISELTNKVDALQDETSDIRDLGPGVRLVNNVGSSLPTAGRVEILHNGEWGSICSSSNFNWGSSEAQVVCKMLGYNYPYYLYSSGDFGEDCSITYGAGTGFIWLDNFNCRGSENSLYDCNHGTWGSTSCSHSDDVCVRCF